MKGGAIKTHKNLTPVSIRVNLDDTSWRNYSEITFVKRENILCSREKKSDMHQFSLTIAISTRSNNKYSKEHNTICQGTWCLSPSLHQLALPSQRPVTLGNALNYFTFLSFGFLICLLKVGIRGLYPSGLPQSRPACG